MIVIVLGRYGFVDEYYFIEGYFIGDWIKKFVKFGFLLLLGEFKNFIVMWC